MTKACCFIADLRPEPAIISTGISSCACAGILTCHQQQALIAWINIIPFWIGETSVRALSQNLLCPRVLPCEVWLYSRGYSFAFPPGGFNSSADRALCVWKPGCISQAESLTEFLNWLRLHICSWNLRLLQLRIFIRVSTQRDRSLIGMIRKIQNH
ncbi:uncharacterized protein LOC124317895 [Daphnia pulicaria]|uniref:uncharacterized protein LOC124317895 n=1 Tax=Daphnia pulicaria TaxID=35523 RepID=UPI001EEB9AF3|nr:uncharacterized protein LOC124317895 [Daphnia pulicaria]